MHVVLRGGMTRFPKFKFSAKFPIGLHAVLQLQIKKNQNLMESDAQNYFNRKSIEVQVTRLYVRERSHSGVLPN